MLVILKSGDYDFRLDKKVKDADKLQNLLVSYSAKEIDSLHRQPRVNNPSANSEELIAPLNSL